MKINTNLFSGFNYNVNNPNSNIAVDICKF
jgi:hypothetical protein